MMEKQIDYTVAQDVMDDTDENIVSWAESYVDLNRINTPLEERIEEIVEEWETGVKATWETAQKVRQALQTTVPNRVGAVGPKQSESGRERSQSLEKITDERIREVVDRALERQYGVAEGTPPYVERVRDRVVRELSEREADMTGVEKRVTEIVNERFGTQIASKADNATRVIVANKSAAPTDVELVERSDGLYEYEFKV